MISTLALIDRARAISTTCCWATLSSRALVRGSSGRPRRRSRAPASWYIRRQSIRPPARRLAAHQDVFGDVEVGEEARLLVDGGDAVFLRLARAGEADRLSVEEAARPRRVDRRR